MNSEKPTQEESQKGYKECECGHGIELLQAGFEVKLYPCRKCQKSVAARDEFFSVDREILSK